MKTMRDFIIHSHHRHRLSQFEGLTNFRDIGGIATQSGGLMRQGILFRSDELSKLSRKDLQKLGDFGLKSVIDLRTPNERRIKVDRLPGHQEIRMIHSPFYHQNRDFTRWEFSRMLVSQSRTLDFEQLIKGFYHRMVFENAGQIGELVTLLSDKNNLPALIHCTGGKDRTGIIAALLQLLAGVPRETVREDYLLSNALIGPRMKRVLLFVRCISFFKISPERIQPMLEVRSDYLDEVIEKIFAEYGDIETYFKDACGVTEGALKSLKKILMT